MSKTRDNKMDFINQLKMNGEQKIVLEKLKKENKALVNSIIKILKECEKAFFPFDKEMDNFFGLMKKLEKANSKYPFGHFTNYYYSGFAEPLSESFLLDTWDKNPNYRALTLKDKEDIEKELPSYEWYEKITGEMIKQAKEVIRVAISENIIILRIVGISDKYNVLTELDETWWCSQKVAEREYGLKGNYLTRDSELPITLPYHRELMMKYDTLHNTTKILRAKLEKAKGMLNTINSFLPFAELLPISKMPQTVINVDANANNESISVGNSNQFEGDTVVGKGGKIGE